MIFIHRHSFVEWRFFYKSMFEIKTLKVYLGEIFEGNNRNPFLFTKNIYMKRILFITFAFFISLTLMAQEKSPAEKARIKANRFAKEWQLEHRQRDNVYAVYLAQEKKITEIAHLQESDSKEFRKQRKAIVAEAEKKLVRSLNKYQRAEYQKIKAGGKKRKKRKRRRKY